MSRPCKRCQHPNAAEARFCLKCGAMLEVDVEAGADPLLGKVLLDRYRIKSVLGEGGMGKVYLADKKMGTTTRPVAIKTLLPELVGDPQLVARFHRECATVVELNHPNTVQFFDFEELDGGMLIIVMEYLEGEDLADLVARGAIDPVRVDKILIQICGSLNEAHKRGVVHRDLKPENVLLTNQGGQKDFVKVLDFGIAKRSEAEDQSRAKLTKQGMVLGTPPYMSPEQFSGQALDARSDIYSLGVMTYEMLTGRLPFSANTPWEWATKHMTQAPAPVEYCANGQPLAQNKRDAVMRALSKNRDERQPTILEFLNDFTGLADAQSAWTMATSGSGLGSGAGTPTPRVPIGTPGPMAAAHVPTPTPQGAFNQPSHGGGYASMGGATGGTGGYTTTSGSSGGGAGLWVALGVAAILFLGIVGIALAYVLSDDDDPIAHNPPVTAPVIGTTATTGQPPMVPSTPMQPMHPMNPLHPSMQVEPTMVVTPVAMDTVEATPTDGETMRTGMRRRNMRTGSMTTGSMTTGTMQTQQVQMGSTASGSMSTGSLTSNGMLGTMMGGSSADLQRALRESRVSDAIAIARRGNVDGATRAALENKGTRQIQRMIASGNCRGAQRLYTQLQSVRAHNRAQRAFGISCARP